MIVLKKCKFGLSTSSRYSYTIVHKKYLDIFKPFEKEAVTLKSIIVRFLYGVFVLIAYQHPWLVDLLLEKLGQRHAAVVASPSNLLAFL